MAVIKRTILWIITHKIISIIILIALIVIIITLGTKLFLLSKFLVGHDVIVKLKADETYFVLDNDEEALVEFETSVTTNPFCEALCTSQLNHISYNNIVDQDSFTLKPTQPIRKSYLIKASSTGIGLDLLRFDVQCYNIKKFFCPSDEELTTRTLLVTLNYTFSDDKLALKEKTQDNLENMLNQSAYTESIYNNSKTIIELLNYTVDVEHHIDNSNKIGSNLSNIRESWSILQNSWIQEDYGSIDNQISDFEIQLNETKKIVELLDKNVKSDVLGYNLILNDTYDIKEKIVDAKNKIDGSTLGYYNILVNEFNKAILELETKNSLAYKQELVQNLTIASSDLLKIIENNIIQTTFNVELNTISISEINLNFIAVPDLIISDLPFNFDDPNPVCCVLGECKACCVDESCRNAEINYPVIFLHGHALSSDTSAEYSLEGFNEIQSALEADGYLNAGTITLFTEHNIPSGIWGLINNPLTLRTSYYFDIFKEPENYIVLQSKSENIDTYSIRLKELIDSVKYYTGRPKVNIVAFSMGGLVTRRYLQIFGEDEVNKVVLIGTPNKGIVGEISQYCPIIGEKRECSDMNADSLFIKKLNSGAQPNIPIHNIIGTGCVMEEGIGDGVVLEEKAKLDNVANYFIKGSCESTVKPLHLELRDIEKYPEVYNIIIKALNETS